MQRAVPGNDKIGKVLPSDSNFGLAVVWLCNHTWMKAGRIDGCMVRGEGGGGQSIQGSIE